MTVRSVRDVRPLLIRAHRGPGLEAEHPVSAVLSDTTGRVLRSIGPDMTTTWRSAAKPFQLEGSLSLLPPATRQALDAVDLSLGAASHSAQPAHIERVRDLMRRLGVTEDQLQCGGHWPMHTESTHALLRGEGHCTAIHNNCSGKHAFMVAAAQNDGADTDYLDPNHPVQRAIRDRVERYSGHPTDDLGTDGCGAPCFVLPLSAMARAWACLAGAMVDSPQTPLARIGLAMSEHPFWMSGDGRLDHRLVTHARERLVSKVGAQGLVCIALPRRGLALVVKCLTGNNEARAIGTVAIMDAWLPDLLTRPLPLPEATLLNTVGRTVGVRTAAWPQARA